MIETTRIRAIIFDWDGIFIPSPLHTIIRIRWAAKEAGAPIPDIKTIRNCWGGKLKEVFNNFVKIGIWTESDHLRAVNCFNIIHQKPFPEIPGVMKMLEQLKGAGIELAIISSRNAKGLPGPCSPTLSATAEQAKIDLKIFGHIQAAEDYEFMKPDPRVFKPTLTNFYKLGIKTDEILVIGDTVDYDFMAAKNHQPPLQFAAVISMISPPLAFAVAGLPERLLMKRITDLPEILSFFPLNTRKNLKSFKERL